MVRKWNFRLVSKDVNFLKKCENNTPEGQLYKNIYDLLSPAEVKKEVHDKFPDPEIHRRNTGYAIDSLLNSDVFSEGDKEFQFLRTPCRK